MGLQYLVSSIVVVSDATIWIVSDDSRVIIYDRIYL